MSPCWRRCRCSPAPFPARQSQAAVLDENAVYSINPKALRKWTSISAYISFKEDGAIEARFRYDVTPAPYGPALAFDYIITLGPARERFPILSAHCSPAPGDFGYQSMCAYLKDAEALMAAIENPCHLLGRPLNDVLSWQRVACPSGCYCDESRTHKWGLGSNAPLCARLPAKPANHASPAVPNS